MQFIPDDLTGQLAAIAAPGERKLEVGSGQCAVSLVTMADRRCRAGDLRSFLVQVEEQAGILAVIQHPPIGHPLALCRQRICRYAKPGRCEKKHHCQMHSKCSRSVLRQ